MYSVKEIFCTLQGEGRHFGRAAVFCRFSGCNLWNGLEKDKSKSACSICDTDFVGTDGIEGGKFSTSQELAEKIAKIWDETVEDKTSSYKERYVVFTGGEPLLQLDHDLIQAVKKLGFEIGLETNGTIKVPEGIDWICVSPKTEDIVQTSGDEIKLLHPYPGLKPDMFEGMNFKNFSLQPLDDAHTKKNTEACVDYCMKHPKWRLSMQLHKVLGIS